MARAGTLALILYSSGVYAGKDAGLARVAKYRAPCTETPSVPLASPLVRGTLLVHLVM